MVRFSQNRVAIFSFMFDSIRITGKLIYEFRPIGNAMTVVLTRYLTRMELQDQIEKMSSLPRNLSPKCIERWYDFVSLP